MRTRHDTWPFPQRRRRRAPDDSSRHGTARLVRSASTIGILLLLGVASPGVVRAVESAPASEIRPNEPRRSEARAASSESESELAEAFARHPARARRAAMILAGEPEALLEIDRIQLDSARQFAELLAPYSRRDRQEVWNLVRYPGLAAELARDGQKSRAELEAIADRYPPEEREAILESGAGRHALWLEIHGLQLEARQRAHRVLVAADRSLLAAFEEIEDRPELMSLLLDNLRWTVRLGSEYREDPAGVAQRFAAIEPELEARRREQESAWAEELADPASSEELERAARAFAEAFGLSAEPAEPALEGYAAQVTREDGGRRSRTLRNTGRSQHAYPYWLGLPDGYATPLYAPLGLADHVGFRIGHGPRLRRRFIPVGLPSAVFLAWYHDVYRSGDRAISRRGVRYYDAHPPPRRRPRAPSAGIVRDGEARPGLQQDGEADRDRGRRTSTAGDSRGRGAGRGSRADATTLPTKGRERRDGAP